MKKNFVLILLICFIFLFSVVAITVSAQEPVLETNKDVYTQGEPILVTASTENKSGKDWIGIIQKDRYSEAIKWEYMKNVTADFDITEASNLGPNRVEYWDLPPGEYTILILPNDQAIKKAYANGTIVAEKDITIVDSPLSTDKDVYTHGEPILVTASTENASGKDWIAIIQKDRYSEAIKWEYMKNVTADFDITKASNLGPNRVEYWDLPPGEYTILILPNDQGIKKAYANGTIVAEKDITITPASVKSPLSVTYELDNENSGLADGLLTITLPEGHYADDIYMWWANEDGKLENYTRIARFKVPDYTTTEFTHQMTPNTLIPAEATRLLVYTYSDVCGVSSECVTVELPEGAGYDFPTEEPIMEFQVISDTHIGHNSKPSSEHFELALRDIALNGKNSVGIFINGDLIDNGSVLSQWTEFWRIYDSVENAPVLFPIIGNHEYKGFDHDTGFNTFFENVRMPDGYERPYEFPYYDIWVNGYHYIFLADSVGGGRCQIGDAQYDWFEDRLAENNDGRPVFVFLHQPMKNTVAGSTESEGWWEVMDDTRMREIIAEHPEIVMFNGHTHWILDSYNTMYGGGENAVFFNTSSVSYLWQSYDKPTGQGQDGSEGYYVKVYKDKLLVLGRDFVNGQWVSSAQFVVNDRNTPETKIDFTPKSSITLGSELVYNVYVPAVENLKSFTIDGKAYENLEPITLDDSKQYYKIAIPLLSSEAARNIVLKATVTSNGNDYTGTWTMSIPKYAKKVIESGATEEEVSLVKDVLAYIRAAYAYFGEVDEVQIAKIDAILGADYDINNAPALNGSAEEPSIGLKGAKYVLKATPAIKFYITGEADSYAFFVNGEKLKTKVGTDDDGTYIEMDVYAYAMAETITYTINGVESGSYHINCYYTFVTTDAKYKDNTELINLIARFAKYCESAAAYRNSVLENS